MQINRLFFLFLLICSTSTLAQKQFGIGAYGGFGLRKRPDLPYKYRYRYGWEAGLAIQFRRDNGKKIHEWNGGLNGHYLDYTYHYSAATNNSPGSHYHYTARTYGLDLLYKFNYRLLYRDKFSLYAGAGFNIMQVVSYRDTYQKIVDDIGVVSTTDWGSEKKYEGSHFGVNSSVSVYYQLNGHWQLVGELNARYNMEVSLTGGTSYTAQNLRIGCFYVFGSRKDRTNLNEN